ncbi:MAG: aminotransferase class III-fold pyridoxal phosphate-dependent enzyme, partial [Candidatus Angelobacter sp.]
MPNHSGLFPRNLKKEYPIAVRGEGCWITAADGRRYLDAAGQAAVVNIGHGLSSVARAMAEQASQLAFAHSSQFHTATAEKLATRLLALAPEDMRRGGRVYFCSGGSEANETAIKLARQYFLERGQPERFRV